MESASSSRSLSAGGEVPPKPARQNSFGYEPKRRRHDGPKFKKAGGDSVTENGRIRARVRGRH